ncbi:MAG: hypothetical protein ACO3O0_02400 [Bacteroidia bacterium]
MQRTIIKILIAILFSLIVLMAFDQLLQLGFRKSTEEVSGKMNVLMVDSTRFDVLCLGSSRALAHLDARLITERTGMKVYNGGVNGARVASMKILLKAYLKAHPAPRFLVLHIDDFTLETDQMLELPHYLPFLSDPEIRERVFVIEPDLRYLTYLPFFRIFYYDDLKKWIAVKSLLGLGENSADENAGYVNLADSGWNDYWESQYEQRMKTVQQPFDSVGNFQDGLRMMEEVLDLADEKNIKVVFTSSPVIGGASFPKYETCISMIERLTADRGTPYLFFWNHGLELNRKEYYYDLVHMVRKGAQRYSAELSDTMCKADPPGCQKSGK